MKFHCHCLNAAVAQHIVGCSGYLFSSIRALCEIRGNFTIVMVIITFERFLPPPHPIILPIRGVYYFHKKSVKSNGFYLKFTKLCQNALPGRAGMIGPVVIR